MRITTVVALTVVAAAVVYRPPGAEGSPAAPRRPKAATCVTGGPVGRVTDVRHPDVQVDGNSVSGATDLFAADVIATDPSGRVFFCLLAKGTSCDSRRKAKLKVQPSPKIVIRFNAGVSSCVTIGGGPRTYDARKGTVRMRLNDPLFEVVVDEKQTLVKVGEGFVEVTGRNPAKARIVGPGQQIIVPFGGDPRDEGTISLNSEEVASLHDLARQLPEPSFSRPDPDRVPRVRTMLKRPRPTIVVALDKRTIADGQTRQFVKSFFEFLGKQWDLPLDLRITSADQVVKDLAAEKVDVLVTSDPRVLKGVRSLPFFADARGSSWQLTAGKDTSFLDAFGRFLDSALERGNYAFLYKSSFGSQPRYDRLRTFLFAPRP